MWLGASLANSVRGTSHSFIKIFLQLTYHQRSIVRSMNVEPNRKEMLSTKVRREKQQMLKKKSVFNAPSAVNLQVIGAGGSGAPRSVYLFTDQARYLFNCGEGTQRLAHEHKTKLPRLEQIFFTRNTWEAIGGFPGLVLTIQDAGVKQLSMLGPAHLDKILLSMRRFVILKTLKVNTVDCSLETAFEDATMSVKCLTLEPKTIASQEALQPVIVYICRLKPRPGTLNLEKCVDAGVPPGPLLGLLKNGVDVTLENGQVVHSKDVSEPGEIPLTFVILDVPSEQYLPALQNHAKSFKTLQDDTTTEVALIVHFSPANILVNNCYQSFLQNLSTSTEHLYLNAEDNSFSGYVSAHRIQYKLNLINKKVFPLLPEAKYNVCNDLKKTKLSSSKGNVLDDMACEREQELKENAITGITSLTNFHLRPRKGLDRGLEAKLDAKSYISEVETLPDFHVLLQKYCKTYENLATDFLSSHIFPKIIFLGTGSCIPNKTRNVSAILLQLNESSYMLLDCGEGTLGQIVRFFGQEKAEHVLRHLVVIYVSHLHADHHIGLIGLLKEYERVNKIINDTKKLLLLAPKQLEQWLHYYDNEIEKISHSFTLVANGDLLEKPLVLDPKDTGIRNISTCLVRHSPHSFGIALNLEHKFVEDEHVKITYSGDTMPCRDLVELGRNSTVLIHEATMEDDLIEEAKIKMHSTISEAIEQGRLMQAKYTILTHFSQRYAKLPRIQADFEHNVAIAFDNMQVTLSDLSNFHLMYPVLRSLFAEHAEELEQKALKRELKLERKRKSSC